MAASEGLLSSQQPQRTGKYHSGLFDCCEDTNVCLETVLCPCCSISRQLNASYGTPDQLALGTAVASLCFGNCLNVLIRIRIKERYDIEEAAPVSCCTACLCGVCSLSQTHRELRTFYDSPGGFFTPPVPPPVVSTMPTDDHKSQPTKPKAQDSRASTTTTTPARSEPKHNTTVSNSLEHFYIIPSLPPGAEKHTVHHVYDGDTLTLTDQRRVRFLGIDTPELKEKQAFAQEGKDLAVKYCVKKHDIWLVFEENGEREDRYGRLLAHLYAPNPDGDGFIFVQAAQVANGFAKFYHPGDTTIASETQLLKCQRDAIDNRRGVWSRIDFDMKVVATSKGKAYHVESCEHIQHIRHLKHLTIRQALEQHLTPCRTCLADQ